jgi:hypothetical protein
MASADVRRDLWIEDLMAEEHTIENWGQRLNIPGEPLTIERAMLLNLGHMNARLEIMTACLQDMQARLTRIELFMAETLPNYNGITRRAALRLLESAPTDPNTTAPQSPTQSNESQDQIPRRVSADGS